MTKSLPDPNLAALAQQLVRRCFAPDNSQTIYEQSQYQVFPEGSLICPQGIIPDRIHLLLDGAARSLCIENNKVACLERLGSGSWIGLASFLTAHACEEVIASTAVTTLAIPDTLILQLAQTDEHFSSYVRNTVFLPELFNLLQAVFAAAPKQRQSLQQITQKLQPFARLFDSSDDLTTKFNTDVGIYVSSNSFRELPIGAVVCQEHAPLVADSILPGRLIALPNPLLQEEGQLESPPPQLQERSPTQSSPQLVVGAAATATQLPLAPERQSQPRMRRSDDPVEGFIFAFQFLIAVLAVEVPERRVKQVIRDALKSGEQVDLRLFAQIAKSFGLQASYSRVSRNHAHHLQTPAFIEWKNGFAVLTRTSRSSITIVSPLDGTLVLEEPQILLAFEHGISLVSLEKTPATKNHVFGFRWLLPFLLKYKSAFSLVLIASLASQLLAIANPILIQVIIDKVISTKSLDVLPVIVASIIVASVLSSLLTGLRSFLLAETTNRIDSIISVNVIDHLLRLPLEFFDQRAVGDLSTRVGELEKIRNFLTGQSLSAIIDLLFVFVYIAIMLFYSVKLTLAALLVVPVQIIIFIVGSTIYRVQLNAAALLQGENQALFVELLGGIQTVKTQGIEMLSRWKWQATFGQYLDRMLKKSAIAIFVNESSGFLQGLSQLLVISYGAILVIEGSLSLGALIAFRIIAGYATQPMLRIASILQSLQEIKVSINRLADIVDTPEEETGDSAFALPAISGTVEFKDVSFRFPGSRVDALKNISLNISTGTFLAVVGQSGSGKSTLTKLLTRLYAPKSGSIRIDGYDIKKVALSSLRHQVGVVPQDPLLFRGTIRDNIAIADSDASIEQIAYAANLACADEFIEQMPYGYNTNVGERGSSLSGGQRQRITLARTLLRKPKLLILDEATSALDYQTEVRLCQNLLEELKESTVFYVTHRLASIRDADLIMVMHEGSIDEMGTHGELMAMRGRYYSLYTQQAEGDIG